MNTTPHELLADTLQKTHLWLQEVQAELGWEDEAKAYLALKATLHTLRDRLTVDEVAPPRGHSCRCSSAADIARARAQPACR